MNSALDAFGVQARPLRLAVALLDSGWVEFDELVRATAQPRRGVEELLTALGEDLERDGSALRLRPGSAGRWRELAGAAARRDDLSAEVAALVADVPPPLPALDHVQATPETVVARARWLDEQYDLRSVRLTFVGDHDLTSLAVRALRPEAELTVVDVDDRILSYIDRRGERSIRTVHADLRFGLPLAVAGNADVVFSDPPYTPEGMGLFAARGIECLADPPNGRLVLAYGYSPRHPALGHQVQRALLSLGLAFEAIVPEFHRYAGAQAIGSAADLYVCQPTARSRKKGKGKPQGIYTHGPQSVESHRTPAALLHTLGEFAGVGGREVAVHDPDWTKPVPVPEGHGLAVDLTADPGPWLARVLLAANAERVALLLPNAHPDLADAQAQRALTDLVADKYRLRLLRSTPDNKHAVVVADAVTPDDANAAVHAVWTRAHGRVGNLWPHAASDIADLRLIDLPRHRIDELRREILNS
ncbi:bis-aminopropyl spermidine synthase family protein [Prauserella cavernicola]|uniref:Bis-aminopropyl spermidine synthase family protein n=1 Tax=Prauserella cavernicola TaxID=2800127 RepID=A0A934QSJ2_9PSEU|nr:bis-aminopropyl spermidine synthase family protein [Prauserella cavernicola]MBK1785750.1 bis-aminopropyl spermidine synthase family protein [Prauserella cavernicola]